MSYTISVSVDIRDGSHRWNLEVSALSWCSCGLGSGAGPVLHPDLEWDLFGRVSN